MYSIFVLHDKTLLFRTRTHFTFCCLLASQNKKMTACCYNMPPIEQLCESAKETQLKQPTHPSIVTLSTGLNRRSSVIRAQDKMLPSPFHVSVLRAEAASDNQPSSTCPHLGAQRTVQSPLFTSHLQCYQLAREAHGRSLLH